MKVTKWLLGIMILFSLVFCISLGVSAKEIYTYHQIAPGETVWKIAQKYQVDMDVIVTANGLKNSGNMVMAYETILIDSNAKSNSKGNYVVKSKDTLYQLAKANKTSVEKIMSANGLTANRIYVGQKLYIPNLAATKSTATSNTATATAAKTTATVSSSSSSNFTDEEVMMIAKMIYGEARGESYLGQVAVGAVIVNRVYSSLFPNTVAGVLFQKSQFTAYSDGQYFLTPNDTAIKAAKEAVAGVDPTGGCLFYWNPVKAPNNAFLNAKTILATIGEHVFAK